MSRIPTPTDIQSAPAASQPLLSAVKQQLGSAPNMFRLLANSPATLEGHLGLFGGLGKGSLGVMTGTRIAIAVANVNGCDYCNSAHTYLGANLAKLDDAEMAANRMGKSNDPKADAAVRFSVKLVQQRGHVTEDDLRQVKLAGYSDAELIEIVGHVALNTFTNYINEAFGTDVDFPAVQLVKAA